MENKITVFLGKGSRKLKEQLSGYVWVREFKYERRKDDPLLSESDYVLYRLGRRYEGGFVDEVAVGCDNGEFDPVFFDDFIARVDEAEDVTKPIEEILSLGVEVFYFAELESSLSRLKGLPVCIFREDT